MTQNTVRPHLFLPTNHHFRLEKFGSAFLMVPRLLKIKSFSFFFHFNTLAIPCIPQHTISGNLGLDSVECCLGLSTQPKRCSCNSLTRFHRLLAFYAPLALSGRLAVAHPTRPRIHSLGPSRMIHPTDERCAPLVHISTS